MSWGYFWASVASARRIEKHRSPYIPHSVRFAPYFVRFSGGVRKAFRAHGPPGYCQTISTSDQSSSGAAFSPCQQASARANTTSS